METEMLDSISAVKLLEELKPLLEMGDIECLSFIDRLRAVEGSEELIGKMESYDFETAFEEFNDLLDKLGSN